MDTIIKLISMTQAKNEYGVDIKTFHSRQVFCRADSVTRTEFFEGGRNGLNPAFRFVMFRADYNGETAVEYEGQTYSIYRTYATDDDYIELYVERKGGTNGEGN